jgi:uncharacterized protein (TIGR02284 family)
MAKRDDITALNHISQVLIDAGGVYQRAEAMADDPNAKGVIGGVIEERRKMLVEMRERVRAMGGKPVREGSALGGGHSVFMKLRSFFERDTKVAAAEVDRGEDFLRDEIRKAMRNDKLSAETRAFFGVALDDLVRGHDKVSRLKLREEVRDAATRQMAS